MVTYREPMPILSCDDLASMLAFYSGQLGFEVVFRYPEDGEPEFVAMELDGRGLALAGKANPTIHGTPYGPRGGHLYELCIYTDDVDTAVEELRSAGVRVMVEPVDQPWNERLAYVADPDGNPVMICAPIGT